MILPDTTLYIFRHGDTVESGMSIFHIIKNWLSKKRDTHNLDILPTGIPALKRTGEFLSKVKTDANFCSPYPRCIESAKIVEKISGKKFKIDDRLRELENRGESFPDFEKRVSLFLKELASSGFSSVAICTHGAVIAAIKHLELNGKLYFFQVVDYPRPGVFTIIKGRNIKEVNFNN